MKSSFLLLSILSLATVGVVDAQQAQAQSQAKAEPQSPRFNYGANVWKQEEARVPREMEAPSGVRQGMMPHSSNFLGLSPSMLSKPVPAPVLAARTPVTVPSSQISHKIYVPGTAYTPDFGKPVQPMQANEPLKMATLPSAAGSPNAMPKMASAPPPVVQAAAAPVHTSHPHHTNASVSGRVLRKPATHGESAPPAVAAYSSGYTPGSGIPSQSGAGMRADTSVHGIITTPMKH